MIPERAEKPGERIGFTIAVVNGWAGDWAMYVGHGDMTVAEVAESGDKIYGEAAQALARELPFLAPQRNMEYRR